ncbi:hypothetical protein AURDEDRAFT_170962 [Auricularia subglabra TFB-10046 SS5]|nr:hypothetical protein AURDEDRAFT_170962 [Auricularia subglabra TFB-10046 SS5]
MIDYQSPEHLAKSIHGYILSVHIIFGIYLWEFLTSLDFDWLYIRGQKRWTLAAGSYFLTRYLGLAVWILGVRICNVFEPIDCRAWNLAISVTAYGAGAFTGMLLLLRVAALSSRNIYILVFLGLFYGSLWGTTIWGMYHTDGIYIEAFHICGASGVKSHQLNTTMAFAFDTTCLALMMFYLLRARRSHSASLWAFMLQQGVLYVVIISTSYLFVLIILYLDLNDAISQTANSYAVTGIMFCAMRMHRALVRYNEPSSRLATSQRSNTVSAGVEPFSPRRQEALNVTVTVDKYDDDQTTVHKGGNYPSNYPMKNFESSRRDRDEYHLGQV